jgi:cell division protein FtsA
VSKKERIVCGLDVGTEKICCLIGRVQADGCLEVAGSGYAQSAGLKKGVVVNLEEAAAAIRKAAQDAELKSSLSIDWVTVGVSGDHIQSLNCHGAVAINGKHHEATDDMAQVIRPRKRSRSAPAHHPCCHRFFRTTGAGILGLTGQRLTWMFMWLPRQY